MVNLLDAELLSKELAGSWTVHRKITATDTAVALYQEHL